MAETEHDDGRMRRRLGMSRRDLIRRGAIIGGTLVWTIPVVKTIGRADVVGTSPWFTCCECRSGTKNTEKCTGEGGLECATAYGGQSDNPAACEAYCAGKNKAYCYHASPTALTCVSDKCNDGAGAHTP